MQSILVFGCFAFLCEDEELDASPATANPVPGDDVELLSESNGLG